MIVLDRGHKYQLKSFDGNVPVILTFVKREGEGFPGNTGHYPSTNLQSVLRACIDRLTYLQGQIPDDRNLNAINNIGHAVRLLEERAMERHGFNPKISIHEAATLPMCDVCGHVICHHKGETK